MRIKAPNFSLSQTIESGQLFRYEIVQEGYLVSHGSRAFLISQEGSGKNSKLVVHARTAGVTEAWLTNFFAIKSKPPTPVDNYSAEALEYCKGMRVCRQDPWECTIGFICSQNNNIPRIRQLMTGLAKAFGKRAYVGNYAVYLFPNPGEIRRGHRLKAIKTGYREKYLLAASNSLTHSKLRSWKKLSYEKTKENLLSLNGVGPKVADCILLFAYGHSRAFPIDTWVETIMNEKYGGGTKKEMQKIAEQKFGEEAGVMQQYLFHYRRQI